MPTRRLDLITQDVDNDSVKADDIDIGGADLVSKGDFLPLFWADQIASGAGSTSSDTYTFLNLGNFDAFFPSGSLPANAEFAFGMSGKFDNGGDRLDVKLVDNTSSNAIVEGLDINNILTIGPEIYDPPTEPVELILNFRNGDGTTTVTVSKLAVFGGIQL